MITSNKIWTTSLFPSLKALLSSPSHAYFTIFPRYPLTWSSGIALHKLSLGKMSTPDEIMNAQWNSELGNCPQLLSWALEVIFTTMTLHSRSYTQFMALHFPFKINIRCPSIVYHYWRTNKEEDKDHSEVTLMNIFWHIDLHVSQTQGTIRTMWKEGDK